MSMIDSNKFIHFLDSKWTNSVQCPICNATNWNTSNEIFEMSKFHREGGLFVGGLRIPLIPISCTNCGYTFFINAIISGVVDPMKEDVEK